MLEQDFQTSPPGVGYSDCDTTTTPPNCPTTPFLVKDILGTAAEAGCGYQNYQGQYWDGSACLTNYEHGFVGYYGCGGVEVKAENFGEDFECGGYGQVQQPVCGYQCQEAGRDLVYVKTDSPSEWFNFLRLVDGIYSLIAKCGK